MIEKIKRHLLNGVLLLVLLSSCKKEISVEIQQESQSNLNEIKFLVTQVKTWHDSTVSSNLSSKIQNVVRAFSVNENDIVPPIVDWEKAFINFDSSSVKSITVPISMNYKTGEHMQLVATRSKNKINGYFIKVTPDSAYFANQIEVYNYTDFSGSIAVYNLMGIRLKKQDFKVGIVSNSNNNSKSSFSNITTFGSNDGNLIDVTVIGYRKKKSRYNYGLIYIDEVQNIELDDYWGGGDVIAGGSDIDYDLFAVPDGQCVFGALGHLGSLLGGNSNVDDYITKWAIKNGVTFSEMNSKLINDKYSRPNTEQSIRMLEENFNVKNLISRDNMLLQVRVNKKPIFVLINWGNGNGHNIIVKWSDKYNKIVFFDPIENLDDKPYEGSYEFDRSRHFFEVYEPK